MTKKIIISTGILAAVGIAGVVTYKIKKPTEREKVVLSVQETTTSDISQEDAEKFLQIVTLLNEIYS